MKENGVVGKKAVYIALGVNREGKKDILSMYIGTNESAKTWLSLFNDFKNRRVKDILVMCVDLKTIYNAPTEEQAKNNLDYSSG